MAGLERDLEEIKARLSEATAAVEELRRDSAIHVRRCGELQHELNELKKTLVRG